MIHLNYSGLRHSIEIERAQLVAANNGVFLRITTQPQQMDTALFAPIRESARRVENRWQIDGINFNLSCRNVEFVITNRRPLTTSLLVDLYMPLNQAIDISFQQYTPSEGNFGAAFSGTAEIAPRQTGAFPAAVVTGRSRTHRPVSAASIPRQMRELTATEDGDPIATTMNAPDQPPQPVVPNVTDVTEPPERNFLRRFDNIDVEDEGV